MPGAGQTRCPAGSCRSPRHSSAERESSFRRALRESCWPHDILSSDGLLALSGQQLRASRFDWFGGRKRLGGWRGAGLEWRVQGPRTSELAADPPQLD